MEIIVLGTGCTKCNKVYAVVEKVIAETGITATLRIEEDIVKIISYNVMTTPAVVVDGVVKIQGSMPTETEIKKILGINMESDDKQFIQQTIRLAAENVKTGMGGPFAALVVKDGQVITSGTNLVTSNNDPTAHAEITAIRNACKQLGSFQLDDCTIYASCEPCPMCLGAIYWARPKRLVFAADKRQAAAAGFDDVFIYKELELPYMQRSLQTIHTEAENDNLPFELWIESGNKTEY